MENCTLDAWWWGVTENKRERDSVLLLLRQHDLFLGLGQGGRVERHGVCFQHSGFSGVFLRDWFLFCLIRSSDTTHILYRNFGAAENERELGGL